MSLNDDMIVVYIEQEYKLLAVVVYAQKLLSSLSSLSVVVVVVVVVAVVVGVEVEVVLSQGTVFLSQGGLMDLALANDKVCNYSIYMNVYECI